MKLFLFSKSSYSSAANECLEVARNIPDTVAVRDSKDHAGPVVTVSPAAWSAFVSRVGDSQRP